MQRIIMLFPQGAFEVVGMARTFVVDTNGVATINLKFSAFQVEPDRKDKNPPFRTPATIAVERL